MSKAEEYQRFSLKVLSEDLLRRLDFPRFDPTDGVVRLYGDHFGFQEGQCKRCEKPFDVTFTRRKKCDFHTEKSLRYGRRQHPHGCCGKNPGSEGCRIAASHVHKGNLYLDMTGYRRTETRDQPKNGHYGAYALDTESIIHDKVVDTVILYPHKLGLPRRRSLKEIAETELRVTIQTGEGHDSEKDANITMRLALKKV